MTWFLRLLLLILALPALLVGSVVVALVIGLSTTALALLGFWQGAINSIPEYLEAPDGDV